MWMCDLVSFASLVSIVNLNSNFYAYLVELNGQIFDFSVTKSKTLITIPETELESDESFKCYSELKIA